MALFSGNIFSNELRQTTHVNVIVPDESEDFWPIIEGDPSVVYLLHGLGGNCDEWVRFSKIETYAKLYDLIVVMPEVQRSFYRDTMGPHYLTFVADELPRVLGEWLRIPSDREHTFVAGESMGGYGAGTVLARHPERFFGAALLSAVTDPRASLGSGGLLDWGHDASEEMIYFGERGATERDSLSESMTEALKGEEAPRIYQACGLQDALLEQSRSLSSHLDSLGVRHVLETWDGGHDFLFWDVAVERAIRWFRGLNMEDVR